MGIQNLNKIIEKYASNSTTVDTHLQIFAGKVIAIDASIYLYLRVIFFAMDPIMNKQTITQAVSKIPVTFISVSQSKNNQITNSDFISSLVKALSLRKL